VNYLSNITPQNSSLNRTSWKYLEEKERELVNNNKYNKLYILAGTYNITNQETSLSLRINCVNYQTLIKIVKYLMASSRSLLQFSHKECNIALDSFIFKNQKPKDSNFCNNITTIDNIETLTNINIMPASSNLQNNITLLEDLGC
jgi:DNA/RNA endonuclease G (NUC1)